MKEKGEKNPKLFINREKKSDYPQMSSHTMQQFSYNILRNKKIFKYF